MSDVIDAPVVEASEASTVPHQILQIPVVKAKTTIAVDVDALPAPVFKEVVIQGLKVLVNRGTSKVTGTTYPNPDELKAKAMEIAQQQVANLMAGKVKATGGKAKEGVSGAVMTEARRIARNLVKEELKRQNEKISQYSAGDITKAANELLAAMPELIEQAQEALEERAKKPLPIKLNIHADPKKIEQAKKKTKPDGTISAAQAAQSIARSKGKPASVVRH